MSSATFILVDGGNTKVELDLDKVMTDEASVFKTLMVEIESQEGEWIKILGDVKLQNGISKNFLSPKVVALMMSRIASEDVMNIVLHDLCTEDSLCKKDLESKSEAECEKECTSKISHDIFTVIETCLRTVLTMDNYKDLPKYDFDKFKMKMGILHVEVHNVESLLPCFPAVCKTPSTYEIAWKLVYKTIFGNFPIESTIVGDSANAVTTFHEAVLLGMFMYTLKNLVKKYGDLHDKNDAFVKALPSIPDKVTVLEEMVLDLSVRLAKLEKESKKK